MSKVIRLGSRLRYPITIVKLLKAPNDKIRKQEPLLQYSFKWMKEVGDTIRGDTWQEEQTTIVTWESPSDGELTQWRLREGQHVTADTACMVVKEECAHDIQYGGLCAMCGKDMTEVNWAAETRDTERATISMVHDHTGLLVSEDQAHRTEEELQRRLLENRKLSLVVDLDQTIIQACIDPTVGEWQRDPTNPNHESVKEVKVFQLDDGPATLARRCSYYIKMRPGLEGFLKRISDMYELHVYTMGTRAYAQHVARVVDPDKRLFGNRVISRDENGNMYAKSLQRLFPVSTHMVVIIDDRSDVWPRNRNNLIKVSPYEFFKGIGDINSSFLPKRQDLLTSPPPPQQTASKKPPRTPSKTTTERDDAAAMEAIVNMTGGDDSASRNANSKSNPAPPLQLLQEKLDRQDAAEEEADTNNDDNTSNASRSSSPRPTATAAEWEGQVVEEEVVSDEEEEEEEEDTTKPVGVNGRIRLPMLKLVSASGVVREVDESDDDNGGMDKDFEPGLLPDALPDGQMSPIDGLKTFNWGSVDKELEDFLGESDDEEEDEDHEEEGEMNEEKDGEDADAQLEGGDEEERGRKRSRSQTPPSLLKSLKRKSRDEESESEDGAGDQSMEQNGDGEVGEG
ncbi:CTD phosphatase Fcp1 [Collariella sp. IMI 366227]|nr:CTD phosphatase Fcp1 [Collariella sp. IMI 366227]